MLDYSVLALALFCVLRLGINSTAFVVEMTLRCSFFVFVWYSSVWSVSVIFNFPNALLWRVLMLTETVLSLRTVMVKRASPYVDQVKPIQTLVWARAAFASVLSSTTLTNGFAVCYMCSLTSV